jgi:hypothetical protein
VFLQKKAKELVLDISDEKLSLTDTGGKYELELPLSSDVEGR